MNILICGSQRFEDEIFVHKTLETFYEQTRGNISKLFTSKFAGSCEFARKWVHYKNDTLPKNERIELVDFAFDGLLEKKNTSLYDALEIPEYAIQNDPFFQRGKELIIAKGINLVLAFPNKEGILGASTRNIIRFANLAGVYHLNCSELFSLVQAYRKEKEQEYKQNNSENLAFKVKNMRP